MIGKGREKDKLNCCLINRAFRFIFLLKKPFYFTNQVIFFMIIVTGQQQIISPGLKRFYIKVFAVN